MKIKNIKSALHNFAHSLISTDYTHSAVLALNILNNLNKINIETRFEFDFIKATILPIQAINVESEKLLNDYRKWLPLHLKNHNTDLSLIENLKLIVCSDFQKIYPLKMNDLLEIEIECEIIYQIKNRERKSFKIS
ncbi:hypothetical protein ND856_18980 [Leptospira bandrabouensis]|uniref:hypothetical protein n=1 Tax=Leptospira bandrabouensis TaxID=2484903 RepID=UPI00223D7137|nr:hypothetical protein [Leptospira bandrabouensis]MCW7460416.1 hypothetical protein [Leptospira bandrabouensis]MCW7479392.1 hypothetical protein [Leptospira bandrabouensis]MCW7487074.1 hypothetical protein [Leptospira bandrabouensis]